MTINYAHSRRGFTLIEIMVAVGIIVLLVAILLPTLRRVRTHAANATTTARIQAIQNALETYFTDFKVYPSSHIAPNAQPYGIIKPGQGNYMLSQGLLGWLPKPVDGAGAAAIGDKSVASDDPMYGFRTRNSAMGGKIYGPYLDVEQKGYIQRGYIRQVANPGEEDHLWPGYFVDNQLHDFLYYRSRGAPAGSPAKLFASAETDVSFFWGGDNLKLQQPAVPITDPNGSANGTPSNDITIDNADNAFMKMIYPNVSSTKTQQNDYNGGFVLGSDSYLLISPGLDEVYFSKDDLIFAKP